TVIDGPFAETKELIAGYWIFQVRSLAEAIEWVKRCPNPHEGESEIEIRQFFELEDFGSSPAVEHHRAVGEQIAKKKQLFRPSCGEKILKVGRPGGPPSVVTTSGFISGRNRPEPGSDMRGE